MNKTYFSLLALGMAAAAAAASPATAPAEEVEVVEQTVVENVVTPSLLTVDRIGIAHADSMLRVSFDISPRRVKPGRDRQVVFTPVIRSNNPEVADSIVLDPLTIAGRNRYYSRQRKGGILPDDHVYQAGSKGTVEYRREVPWQPWMEDGYIYMREETQDCCKPVKPLCDTPIAQIGTIAGTAVKATNSSRFIALTGDEEVELDAQGSAFIDFVVNRTEIRDDYRRNPEELQKIIDTIDLIRRDPDATITKVTIKGYASPEGAYDNNVRLAMGRTQALKEYVRGMYDFPDEIMVTNYEPEDWDGLREWLLNNEIANREGILEIVNSDLAPDPKDAAIKSRFPKEYKWLLRNVYPALRHSDYTVRYKIKTYVDIEDLIKAFKEDPRRLRPVDFYRVAQTYPVGSPEFEAVLLIASDTYPHDEEAAINAANILMRRRKTDEASKKLSHAGESAQAYYSRGMLAMMNEDFDRAALHFEKAKSLGMEEAGRELDKLNRNKAREIITYFLRPVESEAPASTDDTGEKQ